MGQHVTLSIQVFAGSLFSVPSKSVKRKKCDSHCWHSHCCRTFFAPMSHRTAGIRTFDIRTLVSFALLTPSHCWHSHCWLRTGVVRTSVFRTLVVQAVFSSMFSSSELQAITKPSISPSHGVVRKPEKVYFVRRKQTVKGKGKEEKKDDVTNHQRKGSLPSPLSPSHSPFTFYSPSCKTVLLLPR